MKLLRKAIPNLIHNSYQIFPTMRPIPQISITTML